MLPCAPQCVRKGQPILQNRFMKILPWVLTVLCMCMISGFSAQTGDTSASLSGDIAAFVARVFTGAEPDRASALFERIHTLVRKLAHVGEFFMLAILVGWALSTLERIGAARFPTVYAVCFTYAFLDEWLQTSVSGRAGRFEDVLIDMAGVALAIAVSYVYLKRGGRRRA